MKLFLDTAGPLPPPADEPPTDEPPADEDPATGCSAGGSTAPWFLLIALAAATRRRTRCAR